MQRAAIKGYHAGSYKRVSQMMPASVVITTFSIMLYVVGLTIVIVAAGTNASQPSIGVQQSSPSDNELLKKISKSLEQLVVSQRTFCGSTGWTKVAHLDMSADRSQQCPPELRLYDRTPYVVRACGRKVSSTGSCDSVTFSTNGVTYSEVCGRVLGYQYYGPRGVNMSRSIDENYVDGVSITRGSPREHIWTLIANTFENSGYYPQSEIPGCPCANSTGGFQSSFIGNDYFCESGNIHFLFAVGWIYNTDPLWDGKLCRQRERPCCDAPGIPWFHKVMDSATADDIELRVCGLDETTYTDTPVGLYEIYVK